MTTTTLTAPRRGYLTSLTTGLNAIASSLLAGLDSYFYLLLIWPLAAGLLEPPLLQAGTPTGWRLLTLKALIFSRQLCQRLLMLWVILFFYFGVLSLRGTFNGGANLEGFGPLLLSTVPLPL